MFPKFYNMNNELEHIIEKVSQLYQKYGIKSITMDDVSRELGISKKTLYSFVANKDELVERFVDYLLDERNCEMGKIFDMNYNAIEELLIVTDHLIKMLKNYNPATVYDLKKYYPQQYERLQKVRIDNMYKALLSNLRKGKSQGYYRSELNEDIIAKIYVSRMVSNLNSNVFSMEELSSEVFINEMMTYHIHGIANAQGIEFLDTVIKNKSIKQ